METFVSPNLIWLTMINVNKNSCQTMAVISRATDNYFPIKIISIFCNWDKYIWQFKQIHFKIWKKYIFLYEQYSFCKRSCQTMAVISRARDNYFPIKIDSIFCNWDKYIWQFKQIHFKIWKKYILYMSNIHFAKEVAKPWRW